MVPTVNQLLIVIKYVRIENGHPVMKEFQMKRSAFRNTR